ncbi:MAG: phosphoribosyltransferase family protein, partial [Pseudomonadota bacterium]
RSPPHHAGARVHGLDYIIDNIDAEDQVLLVDDVFDSGRSMQAILAELQSRARRNMPKTVKIACPWFKPEKNQTDLEPDFYIHTTNDWLVFPHELSGLTLEEIVAGKSPEIGQIVAAGKSEN